VGPESRKPDVVTCHVGDDVLAHKDLPLFSVRGDARGDIDRPAIEIAVLVNDRSGVDADMRARQVRLGS
jgi:hypothetical protein